MSHSTNAIGRSGESLAFTYLVNQGFKILERNWRSGRDEIDLIAETDDYIIFVEVKTRKSDTFGSPQEFVTKKKQRFMIRAANKFLIDRNIEKEARFDIIAVNNDHPNDPLEHIPNAFYPLL